ncbi:nephrin isoform X1 [Bemisia tabaci]|uniref:nephrin isoform X1 n=2 Tax=Bemisia tabaci TaxID=7038 RepID=UPI003B27C47C
MGDHRLVGEGAGKWGLGALLVWFATFAGAAHSAKEVPIVDVQAVEGDPGYLPCDISTEIPEEDKAAHVSRVDDDQVMLVLWIREDLGTPIFSMDARGSEFSKAVRWSDETVFSRRAHFLAERVPAALQVDHIRESDAGVYRCRVDFKFAQTRNSKVNLTVIVPPQKLIITDDVGLERTTVVGPYNEHSSLRLKCKAIGGKPKPSVWWHREGTKMGSPDVINSKGEVMSEVTLPRLGRSDLHSVLTCVAANNNQSRQLSASVQIDMNFPPLDVRITETTQPLSAGRRAEFQCQSSGSRPPAKVTWWLDQERLPTTKETTSGDGNTTISTLFFTANKSNSGQSLSCRAENTALSTSYLEDGLKLHVQYKPEPKLVIGASINPNTIREGSDVYFDCTVQADPPAHRVQWKHNGRNLPHNSGKNVIISNQSLVMQGVSRTNAGNYTCLGYNTEGEGESPPFYLNVLYAPTCGKNQSRLLGVAKQERVNISCEVDANPRDVVFRWMFNNSAQSEDVAPGLVIKSGTASVISYTPLTELDYGTLLCWASNKIGHQRTPCVFHIIAAGRPDQVHNCSVHNMSLNSFMVRCSEGFNGGLHQSFIAEVRDFNSQELRANVTSPVPRFTIYGLDPSTNYQVHVFAFNQKGRSEPLVQQAFTLRLPEKHFTSDRDRLRHSAFHLTTPMSVVVGIVGALFIAACFVAAVLRLQCSRNERKRLKQNTSPSKETEKDIAGTDSGGDSDERNPDIIPHPITDFDETERRQLVSTIESARLIHTHGGYSPIRNGTLPLRHLYSPNLQTIPCDDNLLIGGGTLPRQKRTKYEVSSCVQTLRQPIVATPLLPEGIPFPHSPLKVNSSLVNKRESAV